METSRQPIVMLMILIVVNTIIGECFPSIEEKVNSTLIQRSKIYPEFFLLNENLTADGDPKITYYSSHTWIPGGDNPNYYYGATATLDVYGFDLVPGQASGAAIWIINKGDGQPSSLSAIQLGWHIFPWLYKDSYTHFYTAWMSGGTSGKGCVNMKCHGFYTTSSSMLPGHVINPLSSVSGQKSYITLRIFKERYSGDWHIHFGANGDPEPIGYFPKSLLPGLVDNPVEISFGGYVIHKKSRLSPPMGSGSISASGNAASFSSLMLIDEDENYYHVNTNLPYTSDVQGCYTPSSIDSAQFFYGGPGCAD
uniref:Uncharacterized protein n=1 Tax=Avena sativa TaxID=4498 RepID=A0ACD5W517_AVESA